MRQHIGNGLAVLSGQVVSALGSLIGVRILTEYLSPSEYGNLTLGLTLAMIVSQLLTGPLGAGTTRFYTVAIDKKQTSEFISTIAMLFIFIVGVVIVVSALGVAVLWANNTNGWILMISTAAIYSIASGLNSIINGLWLGNNHQVALSFNQGLEPWARILGGIVAIIATKESGEVAFGGYVLGVSVLLLSQFYLLKHNGLLQEISLLRAKSTLLTHTEWKLKIFNYSYPFAIWGVFTTMHMTSDRWLLHLYYGSNEVGYYAVLYQLGYMPMTLLTSMAGQLLTPLLFKAAGDGSNEKRNFSAVKIAHNTVIAALLFMSVAVFVSWLLSDVVMNLLTAGEYQDMHNYLPLFVFSGGLFGAGQIAALNMQSQMKTNLLLRIKIISSVIGIAVNFALCYLYGLLGISISLLIHSIIYIALIYIYGK